MQSVHVRNPLHPFIFKRDAINRGECRVQQKGRRQQQVVAEEILIGHGERNLF